MEALSIKSEPLSFPELTSALLVHEIRLGRKTVIDLQVPQAHATMMNGRSGGWYNGCGGRRGGRNSFDGGLFKGKGAGRRDPCPICDINAHSFLQVSFYHYG